MTKERAALLDHRVNQEGMVLMVLRETKDRVDDKEILVMLAQLEVLALQGQLDQKDQRVFLVKGVLKALLELLEQKVTWASKVHQVHVDPGARQDLMVYAANVVNQAIPALTEPLALLASKENRVQLVLWGKLGG